MQSEANTLDHAKRSSRTWLGRALVGCSAFVAAAADVPEGPDSVPSTW